MPARQLRGASTRPEDLAQMELVARRPQVRSAAGPIFSRPVAVEAAGIAVAIALSQAPIV